MTRRTLALTIASLFVAALPSFALAPKWVAIDYAPLVDGRALSHSGEPVAALLRRLAGRPLPAPGERPEDRVAHALLDPLLEPYAYVLSDAVDSLAAGPQAPFVEVAALWNPGEAQPAWVELLRARALVLESDGHGALRAFVPWSGTGETPASAEAARAAWDAAWPVLRHALAAEQRRLAPRGPAPPLSVSVYAFVHRPERTTFELGQEPLRVEVTDTRPRGDRPPLDLAAWTRLFERGQRLEGARLENGALTLFGSDAATPPRIAGRPVALADVAVAYRAVFHGGASEPYMSLDRGSGPHVALVNYGGRLADTALGLTSLACDVRFKTFSQGLDPQTGDDVREDVRRRIPGFRTHVERFAADKRSENVPGQQTRLWFYPDAVEVALSAQGDVMALRRARMTAAAERVESAGATAGDAPWTEDTTAAVNADYDALAARFPELGALDEAVRLLALFTWLREAGRQGLVLPELDALLAVELPTVPTPRTYPQLLAVNAFTAGGGEVPVTVIDRAPAVDALERLAPADGRLLPAARRFERALLALDRTLSDHAAAARDLAAQSRGADVDDGVLDALAWRAERLRMHQLSLAGLPAATRDALAARARRERLRTFSIGIGGLDLGLSRTFARAARGGAVLDFAPRAVAARAARTPVSKPAAAPGPTTPAPRDAWRADPPGLAATALPAHGEGRAGPVRCTRSLVNGPFGPQPLVETVAAADTPDPRVRRVARDTAGRVSSVERFEARRTLRYALRRANYAVLVEVRPAPSASASTPGAATATDAGAAGPAKSAPAVATLQIAARGAETPAVTLRVGARGAAPVTIAVPRAELQRLVLGPEADATPGRPTALDESLKDALGGAETLLAVPEPAAAQPPWSASAPATPGEEDAWIVATALARWWSAADAAGLPHASAVGVDPAAAAARRAAAAAPRNAVLFAPEDAFPASAGTLREGLLAAVPKERHAAAPRLPQGANLLVLASAEAPGALAARVRRLAADPALRGKYLAVAALGTPLRRDVLLDVMREGKLAALGVYGAPPASLARATAAVAKFITSAGAATKPAHVELVPGPFTWIY